MINKIRAQTGKRMVEVSDPPDAYIIADKDWGELIGALSPLEAQKALNAKYPLEIDGVRVFKKSRVIEVK